MERLRVSADLQSREKPSSAPKSTARGDLTNVSKHLRKSPRYLVTGLAFFAALVASIPASAGDLSGKVMNGTTKRPAVGDEVVVLTVSNGKMSEGPRAKTDGAGHFSLIVADSRVPHLVRVVHQTVPYETKTEPDANTVAIQVYDVADRLDGVTAVMDVQRFEARSDTLEVKQLVTMHNASKPPRTLVTDRPFEIQLQPEAQVESGMVQIENQKPINQKPTPGERKDEYYFHSPLRPGDTRFAVVYRLPYNGEAVVEPRIRNAQERFVVMLPMSMAFEPQVRSTFQPMRGVSPDNVQGTAPVAPGQLLAFRISGTGILAEIQGRLQPSPSGQSQVQRAAQVDRGFHASPGTSRLDELVVSGLSGVLLVSWAVYVLKRRPGIPLAEKYGVPPVLEQNGESEDRRKRRVRVSQ